MRAWRLIRGTGRGGSTALTPGAALASAVLLAGCVSLGGKPVKTLLTLDAASMQSAGSARSADAAATVTILNPVVPAALQTPRVPVYEGKPEISYVKDVAWNDTPAHLFQRLISETVASRNGRVVLDPRQTLIAPGTRVAGQLVRFGIRPDTMQAVVTYDAVIQRGKAISTRRFEATAPVGRIDAAGIGAPLNAAANQVAAQIADWIG